MDPWVILGIEPCSDFKRVRKAYAEKLKRTHPEDDPEGFMPLREVYEYLSGALNCPEGDEHWWMELSEATEPEPTRSRTPGADASRTACPRLGSATVRLPLFLHGQEETRGWLLGGVGRRRQRGPGPNPKNRG